MVWAILVFLGVPLWVCAAGITITVLRNRSLRKRPGDIPVRLQRAGRKRWTRGHALWVSDVFAFRGSPSGWSEVLEHVTDVTLRSPSEEEGRKLHRLGQTVQIATLSTADAEPFAVAADAERRTALVGPFVAESSRRAT